MSGKVINAIRLLALGAGLLFLSGCSVSGGTPSLVGQPAPFTTFIMMDGTQLVLDDLRGKNVAVVFWATHCTFSGKVAARINEFAAAQGKAKNLDVLAVSIDRAEDFVKVKARIEDAGLNSMRHSFSGNAHEDAAYIAFEAESIPAVYVINPQGSVIATGASEDTVSDAFRRR